MVYWLADQESGNIVHFAVIITAQFCTAVGSGFSGLLGNDYRPSEKAMNLSFSESSLRGPSRLAPA